MHGTIGATALKEAHAAAAKALSGDGKPGGAQAPGSARQVRPGDDPRTKAYVEG